MEASGDFGIEPEEGEFHLMFQVNVLWAMLVLMGNCYTYKIIGCHFVGCCPGRSACHTVWDF